jgi:hypothetical protein
MKELAKSYILKNLFIVSFLQVCLLVFIPILIKFDISSKLIGVEINNPQNIINLLAIVNILFFLCFLVPVLYFLISKKYEKYINDAIERFGTTDENLLNEYNNASKFGRIRIGENFTFLFKNNYCFVIHYSDILWVYKHKKTHTTVKVDKKTRRKIEKVRGAEYYSCIIKTSEKRTIKVQYTKHLLIDDVLRTYRRYPNILIGYNKSYNKIYLQKAREIQQSKKSLNL